MRGAADAIGDGSAVENVSCGRRQASENAPYLAALFLRAVFAAAIGHAAKAGKWGQRAVDNPEDLAERDRVRALQKHIASCLSTATDHDSMVLQIEEDLLQELLGNALLLGNVRDKMSFVGSVLARQRHQGPQRIFCLL